MATDSLLNFRTISIKRLVTPPLEDTEYPNESQQEIPDTSEQEDRGDNIVSYNQSQRGKFDTQIEVDGMFYLKASIVKQFFEEHLTSTDRLRSVAGLSKYLISPSNNVQNDDNIVLLGDTVIVKINGALRI